MKLQAHSPTVEEVEKPMRRPKVSTPTHLNAGSAEFMKLYSPMADRMAEAAARSRPASTAGAWSHIPVQIPFVMFVSPL